MTAGRPFAGPPCSYERHRLTDWTSPEGGLIVCGVCHPPPQPLIDAGEVGHRGDPNFPGATEQVREP